MPKTASELRNQARRFDRRQRQIKSYIEWMRRRGCALHIYYQLGEPIFVLGDGTRIPKALGYALIEDSKLVAVDLPLIASGLPQTFRYVE